MAKRANTFLTGLVSLYISLDGRIRRSEYWLGGIALNFVQVVLGFLLMGLVGFTSPAAQGVALALKWVFFWPGFALMVKRGHDRGRSAWVSVAFIGALFTGALFAAPAKVLYGQIVEWVLGIPLLLMGLFLFVDYGFLDGDPGRNRYGPSPKNPDAARPLSFDDDALPDGSASA